MPTETNQLGINGVRFQVASILASVKDDEKMIVG